MFWLGIALFTVGAALVLWSLGGRTRGRHGRAIISAIYAPPVGSAAKQYVGFVLLVVGGAIMKSRLP